MGLKKFVFFNFYVSILLRYACIGFLRLKRRNLEVDSTYIPAQFRYFQLLNCNISLFCSP